MRMKYPIALACLLAGNLALAQKVDLDRYSFTVSYRDLPHMPVDTGFRSYDFQLQTGPLMRVAASQLRTAETVFIEGWIGQESGGDISVSLKMEDLLILKSDVVTREEVKKDKSGNIVSKKIWYAPLLTYSYGAFLQVKDRNGQQIQSRQLVSRGQQYTHKGAESASRQQAANLLLNMFTLTAELSQDVLNQTIRKVSNDLSYDYGYVEKRVNDGIWILDSRKHPEYDAFRRHWGNIQNALFRLQPQEPVDAVRQSLQDDLAYFEKLPLKYSGRDKADRKLRYACYYLLSRVYYWLDDPSSSVQAATSLTLNDYDTRDGKLLEADAVRLQELLRLNKRSSRHFPLYFDSMAATNQ